MTFWENLFKFLSGQGVTYQPANEYVYTTKHFVVLGLVFVATILVYFLFKKFDEKTKRKFLVVIAYTMLTCEILSRISKLLYFADLGKLTFGQAIQVILPIHFCSVIIWVIIFAILFNNKPMISLGAVCGFIGCTIYLLYPAEGLGASFIHLRAFNSVFTHSLGFVVTFNLILFKEVKFEMKDMWKTYVLLVSMTIWAGIMNWIFPYDANGNLNNFMFMIKNPTPVDTGVIPYQIVFAVVGASLFALFYLIPYWLQKSKNKKSI